MSPSPEQADRYRSVNDEVFQRYDDGDFAGALEVVTAARDELAAWDAELALLSACLLGRLDQPDRALAELHDAAARGGWWDPGVVDDDDLAPLRGRPGYDDLLATSERRWRTANAHPDRSGDVVEHVPDPRSVLVALHGAEEEATDAALVWGPVAAQAGAALLAVRSSQRTSPRYRSWPDPARAAQEVLDAWSRLPENLRRLPVVVAGFSAGGRVALQLALGASADAPTYAAVLAVAPAAGPDDLPAASGFVRGRVWIGADDDLLARVEGARTLLEAAGVDVEVVDGLGHAVPDDLVVRASTVLADLR